MKKLLKYNGKHDQIFKSSGKTLDEVLEMSDNNQNEFIEEYILPYILDNINGLELEAEDVIEMIKNWVPGQREEEYDWDEDNE